VSEQSIYNLLTRDIELEVILGNGQRHPAAGSMADLAGVVQAIM
jgi:hypothetical protein